VAALLLDGLESVVRLAQTVEVPGLVGWLLADITSSHDDAVLDLLKPEMPADDPMFVFAANLARRRAADLSWLTGQVTARAGQAGRLLLCAQVSAEVLDLVDAADQEQQQVYWSNISPYRVPAEVLERVSNGLIAADRPFSALVAVSANDEPAPSTDLLIRVLSAPTGGTEEDPRGAMFSLDYQVGQLLDRLEATGVPDAQIAGLEFFYLPALTHTREPRALHRELARDPAVFADVASRVFRPDEEPDLDLADAVAAEDAPHDDAGNDGIDGNESAPESPLKDEEYRFSEACWRLLHDWHDPLPGGDLEDPPSAEDLQAWVDQAHAQLAARRRTRVASMVIGEALAAKTTDPDGTWPCLAVRAVLEHEHDGSLEDALVVSRMNQRGVTGRGVYSGGAQERELAATYRGWSEAVRDRWPRTGAILEKLAKRYEADGRQEDRNAERDARG
jgi:hypothetical protein